MFLIIFLPISNAEGKVGGWGKAEKSCPYAPSKKSIKVKSCSRRSIIIIIALNVLVRLYGRKKKKTVKVRMEGIKLFLFADIIVYY